jgi:hypothetical protein
VVFPYRRRACTQEQHFEYFAVEENGKMGKRERRFGTVRGRVETGVLKCKETVRLGLSVGFGGVLKTRNCSPYAGGKERSGVSTVESMERIESKRRVSKGRDWTGF